MKKLLDTQLLKLLNTKGPLIPADSDIKAVYDDFAHSVVSICTSAQGEESVYFTLHYTRLELEAFQSELSTKGAEKKMRK